MIDTMVITRRRTKSSKALSAKLGSRVLALLQERGWSQRTLGEKADLDNGYISRIINGNVEPCLATLETLAFTFGLTLSEFLEGVTR
jgi:transcriptional regulator with XRE-family HTH domain